MITALFGLAVIALLAVLMEAAYKAYAAAHADVERARQRRRLEQQAAEEIDHIVMTTRAAMWSIVQRQGHSS